MSNSSNEAVFEASMMVYFRERIGIDLVNKINQKIVKNFQEKIEKEEEQGNKKKEETEVEETKNKGKLILDATVAPADITHPNDLGVLNQSRKETEKIINSLHKNRKNKLDKKPRTYRKKARKDYLKVAKKRRPSRQEKRDAISKQLQL